jgi:hypothetical protein
MNGTKLRIILGFHNAVHTRDRKVAAATPKHIVEENFSRPTLIDHTKSAMRSGIDARAIYLQLVLRIPAGSREEARPCGRIFFPIRRLRFESWSDDHEGSSKASRRPADRELVFRFRDNATDRSL